MKDSLLKLQSQFQEYWQSLPVQKKWIIISLAVLLFSSLIALSFYVSMPQYATLFTNLTPEEASNIATKLKDARVSFRLVEGGRTIKVPVKDVHKLRLSLVGEGVLQSGSIGFEIFDKTFFGVTEFQQKINFKRALQGELERTIRYLSAVDQARVHLVLPEKELYLEEEKEPTASVILKLKPGAQLSKSQIKAILNLVKASVEGLKEKNISIVDTSGRLLSGILEEDFGFNEDIVSSHFELKKKIEEEIQRQVLSMLENVLGPGRAVVRATVELDLAKKEATEEKYFPIEDTKDGLLIRSQQKKTEYFKGTSQGGAQGVPGTTSNIGTAPTYQQVGPSGGSTEHTKDESVTNYEVNKRITHTVSVPGEIKRLSLAVLLDGDFPEATLNRIKEVISSGIGINPKREDRIVVENIAFDKSYIEKEKIEMEKMQKREFLSLLIKTGSIVFVTLIILLFTLSMLRHVRVVKKAKEEIEKTKGVIPEAVKATTVTAPELDIKEQILSLAKENPQRVAEAIKSWIGR